MKLLLQQLKEKASSLESLHAEMYMLLADRIREITNDHADEMLHSIGTNLDARSIYGNDIVDISSALEGILNAFLVLDDAINKWTPKSADDELSCPGCGCMPGDGITKDCNDTSGCGFSKAHNAS